MQLLYKTINLTSNFVCSGDNIFLENESFSKKYFL